MEENKILAYVRGNDVLFIVSVTTPEIDGEGQPIEDSYVPVDFTGWDDYSLRVVKQGVTRTIVAESSQLVEGEEGKIVVDVPYTALCGTYSLELVGRQNGRHERSYEIMMFAIVESNDKANLIYEVIEGYKSADLDITVQLVQSALVYGENAYQMWKHLPGNEDKTLQDYIDEVLDLYGIAERANAAADSAEEAAETASHLPYIGADNYVYVWDQSLGRYEKTSAYVKGEQGTSITDISYKGNTSGGDNIYTITLSDGDKYDFISPRGPAGANGTNGRNGIDGRNGNDGADGVGIRKIEYKYTTPYGDNVYTILLTNNSFYDFTAPRGATGPRGANGANGTPGTDGTTPHIDSTSKHWYIGTVDTNIVAEGEDGVGISSITYKETDASGNYVYTITLTNNNTYDITCPKGAPGGGSEVTEQTVAGWGFTKNTGDYSKPSGGIPSTDLSSAVQTSLGKADTAIQIETDPTVPSWAKQSTKPSYTASEVGAVPTSRTVNGKALSSNITLSASDVSALPSSTVIPVVPTNVSAFQNDAGYLTSHQDISGKVDKVASATVGRLASFVSGGGIQDSGYKIVTISSSDYESLASKDANTIYLVTS